MCVDVVVFVCVDGVSGCVCLCMWLCGVWAVCIFAVHPMRVWGCPCRCRVHRRNTLHLFVVGVGSLQFFPRYQRFDAGEIKGFTLLISVRNDHRPMYQLHLVRTNGDLVKMETAPSYVLVVSW